MQENSANKSGKGKEQKEEQKILWIAGALAIFGCLAPIIFTRTRLFEWLDFSNTGEIGDTIGGTMTPIVSLAAVILTYLAFLKQVEANKIQTEQFNETLKQKETDDKKQLKNSLELISLDVDFAIQDMEERIKNFDDYLKDERKRIYGEGFLRNIPTASLIRYRTIDRNLLFNAYRTFIIHEDIKELFRKTYSLLDYYSEKVKEIMPILEKDMQQSNRLHDEIGKELDNFEDLADSATSDHHLIESFLDDVFRNKNKYLDQSNLDFALNHHELSFSNIHDAKIKQSFSQLIKLMTEVKLTNEYIVSEMEDVKKKWEDETLKKLKKLRDVLHKSLGDA